MSSKIPSRIAAADLEDVDRWCFPDVGTNTRGDPGPQESESVGEGDSLENSEDDSELIEDVDPAELLLPGFTAEQLEEIAAAAREEGHAEGHKEGVAAGHAEGHAAGLAAAEQEMQQQLQDLVERLLMIAEAVAQPIAGQEAELATVLQDYVLLLSKNVIERELLLDSSQVLGAVQSAVQALPIGAGHITVSLNPDDLALVENYAQERGLDWLFQGDPDLQPGGCRVKTPDSLVDNSIEKRLAELSQQYLDGQLAVVGEEVEEVVAEDEPDDSLVSVVDLPVSPSEDESAPVIDSEKTGASPAQSTPENPEEAP